MAELFIYDEILPDGYPWGVSPESIIGELDKIDPASGVTVRVNSPGGDVVSAIAIYNAFTRWPGDVTFEIDARAASAASLVLMAGNKIRIAANAEAMVHEPYVVGAVNYTDLPFLTDRLSDYRNRVADMYAARSGRTRDEVLEAFNGHDGTYFNAQQAVDFGMADEIGQQLNVAAKDKCRIAQLCNLPDPCPQKADSLVAKLNNRKREIRIRQLQ